MEGLKAQNGGPRGSPYLRESGSLVSRNCGGQKALASAAP
jgi:hypothetical protein